MTPTPAHRKATRAHLDEVVAVESTAILRGRVVVAYLRLIDGRRASWYFVLGSPPGQDQRLRVIPGA